MKTGKVRNQSLFWPIGLALLLVLVWPGRSTASLEQSFDVLQIGTTTYRNVTVTTKNKNYVFILHSKGMTNIKVSDLSSELRAKLGYEAGNTHKTNTPALWAKQTFSKLETPQVKQLRDQVAAWCLPKQATAKLHVPALGQRTLLICAAALLGLYLFHCYCCMAICQKCGYDPGFVVWVPILQLFPLLKAASMSSWWFVAFLLPGINLLAQVVWFIKITQARGKGFLVALLLIIPLTTPFAVLYLAFSGGAPAKSESPRRVEIMTLETA